MAQLIANALGGINQQGLTKDFYEFVKNIGEAKSKQVSLKQQLFV